MSERDKFGKRVRKLRKDKMMTQEELAFYVGVHRTYIGSVERAEKNLSLKNIFRIAKALDIDPMELFNFEDIK